jgi:hypothetical protein
MLITILNRDARDRFLAFYQAEGVRVYVQFLGKGTVSRELFSILGIGESEKLILLSMLPASDARKFTQRLDTALRMDQPGAVAFTLPVCSLGGRAAFSTLMGDSWDQEEDQAQAMETHAPLQYDLVNVIIDKGFIDVVMEAARSAGATGGTSIHAGGTRSAGVEKFFGISVQDDKEIVWIVVDAAKRANVMKAIMHQAGMAAKALVFSIPVSDVAGIHPRPSSPETTK